jgi:arsenite methyltransferase
LSRGSRIATDQSLPSSVRHQPRSLFESFPGVYAFWREHLFQDHTEVISRWLWKDHPAAETKLLEVGCGPGFYSCRLALRFPQLEVTGIDRSIKLLRRARTRAASHSLKNCRFIRADFLSLDLFSDSFDAVVASRIFTIAGRREVALGELHRTLKSGGRCFVAEPRSIMRAAIPLSVLWLMARVMGSFGLAADSYCEPARAVALSEAEFRAPIASQLWESTQVWNDRYYHYAVCQKPKWDA